MISQTQVKANSNGTSILLHSRIGPGDNVLLALDIPMFNQKHVTAQQEQHFFEVKSNIIVDLFGA